jgi:hypothetical protein
MLLNECCRGVSQTISPHLTVMLPNRWGQASCAHRKRFLCEAPAAFCPAFWFRNPVNNKCYYQSKYAADVDSAREMCQYLALGGNLAKIDSASTFLVLTSWEFWSGQTDVDPSTLAHYWFDLVKVKRAQPIAYK